ncbi:hypothetical protein [uncultured Clostridium sp.]|jgi:hypothetical protein|uniref:hypothetical protein n=1 Tax=uncultured Clostridium sp. TaxID=59620 RepID=UPI00260BB0E7|nr:hypothetical protein [uncultured Clostridium sp.]
MNIKINFFNEKNIACINPLRHQTRLISHPKDDDLEIINNFLINESIDTKSTQEKQF